MDASRAKRQIVATLSLASRAARCVDRALPNLRDLRNLDPEGLEELLDEAARRLDAHDLQGLPKRLSEMRQVLREMVADSPDALNLEEALALTHALEAQIHLGAWLLERRRAMHLSAGSQTHGRLAELGNSVINSIKETLMLCDSLAGRGSRRGEDIRAEAMRLAEVLRLLKQLTW